VRARAEALGRSVPGSLEAYWRGEFQGFDPFIEAFAYCCRFIESAEVVREAIRGAVARLAPTPEGSRGIDLWVSPHLLVKTLGLVPLDALWRGLDEGIREARTQGVRIAVVIDAVNHFGIVQGHEVLDLVLPERPEWIVGFSTGGLERVPFREWAPVFDRARAAGLRLAAHAGENGPGSHVRDAILDAGVERIVHGVRAIQDPAIVELLAERRIPVDICLTSNRALVPGLGSHPLPAFLRAGVRCALGTDDPGVIPCDIPGEWRQAQALGLTDAELTTLGRNAIEDAWCFENPGRPAPGSA